MLEERVVTAPDSRRDRALLARAVALAEQVRATTSPNPPVGCVLARDGRVVGEGATAPPGGPHAEIVALTAAGAAARGATAYVSLEPCTHHGRTPPCTDALVSAGVTRVVYALADPNPLAEGGAQVLRGCSVQVTGPGEIGTVLPAAVGLQLEGFLHTVHSDRPHVTLKLAQTTDGRLVAPDRRRWITGPSARRAVHRWRASVDAVLVGSGTVLADDPRLDVRGVAGACQPRPVVLDARLRTPPDARICRRGAIVLTTVGADAARVRDLEARGVEVVGLPAATPRGVELRAALSALAARGVTSVLAEPGETLARALVEADLVDRIVLHIATGIGDGPLRFVVRPAPGRSWRTERVGGAGSDVVLHLAAAPPTASRDKAA